MGVIKVFKKFALLGAVGLAGLVATVGFAGPAQAYPEVIIDLTVDRQLLYGGENFTATATANVVCDWTLEWNGDSRDKDASSTFVTTYTAPDVTEITKIPLHGTCDYLLPDGATPVTGRAAAGPLTTWKRTIMITVLPQGSVAPPEGGLPNTGGPHLSLLIGGLGMIAAGGVAVARSKKTAE